MQNGKNKNVILLSSPTPIKSLPTVTKVLCLLIAPSIKECDCSYSWKFVSHQSANARSQIKGIYFDQSYSTVAHAESFRINIAIAAMYRITDSILYGSNEFQNTTFTICERVCQFTTLLSELV